jgi:hypothetical protein
VWVAQIIPRAAPCNGGVSFGDSAAGGGGGGGGGADYTGAKAKKVKYHANTSGNSVPGSLEPRRALASAPWGEHTSDNPWC